MARPEKVTVDYFPHDTTHGKTIFVLQSTWGNDGYATWFKILERLGSVRHHVIDLATDPTEAEYLAAYCMVSKDKLFQILDKLAELNAIERGLWRHKLVYCRHFVERVSDAYRRRKEMLPTMSMIAGLFPQLLTAETELLTAETPLNEHLDGRNGERKGKGKLKKDICASASSFDRFWDAYPKKKSKGQAIRAWEKVNPDEQLVVNILAAIERAKTQEDWIRDRGRYIPYPATWINARGWEDELEVVVEPAGPKPKRLPTPEEEREHLAMTWRPEER